MHFFTIQFHPILFSIPLDLVLYYTITSYPILLYVQSMSNLRSYRTIQVERPSGSPTQEVQLLHSGIRFAFRLLRAHQKLLNEEPRGRSVRSRARNRYNPYHL